MKKQFKLGVVGCSDIAKSIVRGAVLSDFIRSKKVMVCGDDIKALDELGEELGVFTSDDVRAVAEKSEFLLFACDNKQFSEIIKQLNGYKPEKVISVIDGIKKNTIKNSLGVGVIRVARCVVNLPCVIGSGAVGIDMSDFNRSVDDTDFISNLFSNVGNVVSLDESKLNAVYAISGVGPVYSFMLIDGLIQAGIKLGLNKNEAKTLAEQSVFGGAELVCREESSIDELMLKTCKAGGGAVEAVKALEDNGFFSVIEKAAEASFDKIKAISEK